MDEVLGTWHHRQVGAAGGTVNRAIIRVRWMRDDPLLRAAPILCAVCAGVARGTAQAQRVVRVVRFKSRQADGGILHHLAGEPLPLLAVR